MATENHSEGGKAPFILNPFPSHQLSLLIPDPAAVQQTFAENWQAKAPYWTRLWPSALALADHLLDHPVRPGRWLEPGAGLGLPGLTLARQQPQSRVLLTDLEAEAVQLLTENIERNQLSNAEAAQLDITSLTEDSLLPYTGLLIADLAYETALHPVLYKLIDMIQRLDKGLLLSLPQRAQSRLFLENLAQFPTQQFTRQVTHTAGQTNVLILHWHP